MVPPAVVLPRPRPPWNSVPEVASDLQVSQAGAPRVMISTPTIVESVSVTLPARSLTSRSTRSRAATAVCCGHPRLAGGRHPRLVVLARLLSPTASSETAVREPTTPTPAVSREAGYHGVLRSGVLGVDVRPCVLRAAGVLADLRMTGGWPWPHGRPGRSCWARSGYQASRCGAACPTGHQDGTRRNAGRLPKGETARSAGWSLGDSNP